MSDIRQPSSLNSNEENSGGRKLLPGLATLFRSGRRDFFEQQYCFTVPPSKLPPLPACASEKCQRGCRPQSTDDSDKSESGDSNEELSDFSDGSDGGVTSDDSSQSSEEDVRDAMFEQRLPDESRHSAKSKADKDIKKEKAKNKRQKGDAESLKKYAYGNLIKIYVH